MAPPAHGVVEKLIKDARERAEGSIRALQALPGEPIDVAQQRAGAAVEHYCADLLDALVAAASPKSIGDWTWVKQRYSELALDFAKCIRDIEPDAGRRHAIAQAVQQEILEAERRLRAVLGALTDPI
jgi:hypothetical protein